MKYKLELITELFKVVRVRFLGKQIALSCALLLVIIIAISCSNQNTPTFSIKMPTPVSFAELLVARE
jgi:hypothetical protein